MALILLRLEGVEVTAVDPDVSVDGVILAISLRIWFCSLLLFTLVYLE
jgi:hypothetical protein